MYNQTIVARSRNLICLACMILMARDMSVCSVHGQATQGSEYYVISITIEDDRQLDSLSILGLSKINSIDGKVMAVARNSHLSLLDSLAWRYVIRKGYGYNNRVQKGRTAAALTLNNGEIIVDIENNGTFTMRRASEGKWLLYPTAGTGFFSVYVDGTIYSQANSTLSVISALRITNQNEASIVYGAGNNVSIKQIFRLEGQALGLYVSVENNDSFDHDVQMRYLLDTQIDDNDGSPLYAPPLGTRTYETDIPFVNFLNWEAWLTPVNPLLKGFGSLTDIPARMVFAWWPNAFNHLWDYTPDPNQMFFTPGFTTSPESDGCVLLYYDFGTVRAGSASNTISTFYGSGPRTAGQPSDEIRQAVEQLRDAVFDYVRGTVYAYAYHSSFALDIMTLDDSAIDLAKSLNQNILSAAAENSAELVVQELVSREAVAGSSSSLYTFIAQLFLVELDFFLRTHIATLNNIGPNDEPPTIESKILADIYDGNDGWTFEQGPVGLTALLSHIQSTGNISVPAQLPATFPVSEFRLAISGLASSIRKATPGRTQLGQETFAYWIVPGKAQLSPFPLTDYLVGSSSSALTGLDWQVEQFQNLGTIKQAVWYGCTAATVLKVGATAVGTVSGGVPAAAVEGFYWTKVAPICSAVSLTLDALSLTTTIAVHMAHVDATAKVRSDLVQVVQMYENTLTEVEAVVNDPSLLDTKYNYSRSVQVSEPMIDDIFLGLGQSVGIGVANVNVTNQSLNEPATALAVMSIPNEINAQPLMVFHSNEVQIAPGASQTLQIPFQTPPNTFFGMNYYFPDITVLSSAGRDSKPAYFKVCGSGALGCYLDNFLNVLSATLDAGQSVSQVATVAANTRRARFVMTYPGSDFDVHIYDQAGNHVGVDYSTGGVDLEIPAASYLGSTTNPEIITIDRPTDTSYRVEVVAVSAETPENCEVILIEEQDHPATVLSLPDSVILAGPTSSDTLQTVMLFREIGGHNRVNNIAFSSSNLVSSTGNVIRTSQISYDAPRTSLEPDSAMIMILSVALSPNIRVGEYYGQLTVSSSANQLSLPIRASIWQQSGLRLFSVNPASGQQSETLDLTITGANFVNGASVAFNGSDISVNMVTFNGPTNIGANITIASDAPTGPRNVIVTNPDGQQVTGPGLFTVEACSGTFSFSDDFEDGNADGWRPSVPSRWSVHQTDGDLAYCLIDPNPTGNEYTFLPTRVDDFVMEVDAKSTATSNKGYLVIFAADGFNNEPRNHYVLRFLTNGVTLFRIVNGASTVLKSVSGDYVGDNAFHRVKVERSLPNIRVSVDDHLLFETQDGALAEGYLGFGVRKRTGCFDNVAITTGTCQVSPRTANIQPVADTPQPIGEEFWVDISVTDVQNLFGLSFEFRYTQTNYVDVVTPASSNVIPGPFLGNDVVFVSNIDEANGKINIGVSRKAGQGGVSGSGVVARIKLESSAATPPGTEVAFSLQDIAANDPSGNAINLNASGATVTLIGLLVWPGDTNNDGLVNQADVLPLGLCWAQTGPQRATSSCSWQGQPAMPWSNENCTHADANGDGIVNQADVLCIGLNWGQTHSVVALSKSRSYPMAIRLPSEAANLDVVVRGNPDPGQEFFMDVFAREVTDLFGLSFELVLTPTVLIEPLSVEPGDENLLGNDIIFFPNIDSGAGMVSVGISRKAGQGGVSGSGLVASVTARMSNEAVVGQDTTWLTIQNVSANDPDGNPIPFDTTRVSLVTHIEGFVDSNIPHSFNLYPNYPNPFNPETRIRYDVPGRSHIRIEIFNMLGQRIRTLVDEDQVAGSYSIQWDGRDYSGNRVASGIYIYHIRTEGFAASRKLVLIN